MSNVKELESSIGKYDKAEFKIYNGKDFFELNLKPREWLVENLIKEGDAVLFVGEAKAGKSLAIQQLIFSLTSGKPFLSEFNVLKPQKVLYVMLEGDLGEMQSRYRRMTDGLSINQENFYLFNSEPLYLSDKKELELFIDKINMIDPDVIIIDPIYMACLGGSLSDDDVVRDFLASLRIVKMKFNCTLIIVHHTHKERRSDDGKTIDEGDSAAFGSVFFQAYPDHVLMLSYQKKSGLRTLTCKTQRSNEIEKKIILKLNESPLMFEEVHDVPSGTVLEFTKRRVLEYLDKCRLPLTAKDIYNPLEVPRSTFHFVKEELIKEGHLKSDKVKGKTFYVLTKWIGESHKKVSVQSLSV